MKALGIYVYQVDSDTGAIALASMLPAIWVGPWTSVIPTTPPLLSEPQLYLPRGANVAVVAAAGSPFDDLAFPTVWQVESDFSFRLANAYVGSFGPSLPDAASRFVFAQPLRSDQSSAALAWLRRAGAAAVLVVRPTPAAVRSVQELLETEPVRVDGLALFLIPSP